MLIDLLSKTTSLDVERLMRISATASKRYKIYEIPKRTEGLREIAHPSRELKAIQRWVAAAIFSRLPIHDAATAYRKGGGIRENAERHRTSKYTTRYDFMNFFPSFRQESIQKFLAASMDKIGIDLSDADLEFIGNVVCRYGRLTIGAPSSPVITNTMMFEFDDALGAYCQENDLIFTRYADDIFVSSDEPDKLGRVTNEILRAKRRSEYLNLRLNHRKTVALSKKRSRRVTGVVITPDHKLSVGRDRKREVKALIHQWLKGELAPMRLLYLRGLLAFCCDIEPDFEGRLQRKYGHEHISRLIHSPDLG